MSEIVRIGVIGAGAIAQVAHLPVLRRIPGLKAMALCDNDLPKAQALATRFDIPNTFDDIEELLKYGDVDAVVICTPNHLHEAHIITALSAGKHVLCERPLTLTVEGGERVLQAAERYGRIVAVGMNFRFRHEGQTLHSFLRGDELGTIHAIRAGWYAFKPSRQMLGWRLQREQSGGGAMLDLGLPLIDLGLWLADNPTPSRVTAMLSGRSDRDVEDAGCALIECESGVNFFVDVVWRYMGEGERFWLEVHGSTGSASLSPLRVFKEFQGSVQDVTPTGASSRENPFIASYRSEWEFFQQAVRGDVETTSAQEHVQLIKVLDAVYRSAQEQREISL